MSDSKIILCEPGTLLDEAVEDFAKQIDTLRSKLEIANEALDRIANGKWTCEETPRAIARDAKKELEKT